MGERGLGELGWGSFWLSSDAECGGQGEAHVVCEWGLG